MPLSITDQHVTPPSEILVIVKVRIHSAIFSATCLAMALPLHGAMLTQVAAIYFCIFAIRKKIRVARPVRREKCSTLLVAQRHCTTQSVEKIAPASAPSSFLNFLRKSHLPSNTRRCLVSPF
jgi:hypothetical protein